MPLLWSNQKIILKILIRKIINLHNSTHKDCFNIRKCWLFSYSFLCCQREVSTRFASLLYFCHGGRIGISCWYFNSSVRLKRFNSWNWLSGALTVKSIRLPTQKVNTYNQYIENTSLPEVLTQIVNVSKIPHYFKSLRIYWIRRRYLATCRAIDGKEQTSGLNQTKPMVRLYMSFNSLMTGKKILKVALLRSW